MPNKTQDLTVIGGPFAGKRITVPADIAQWDMFAVRDNEGNWVEPGKSYGGDGCSLWRCTHHVQTMVWPGGMPVGLYTTVLRYQYARQVPDVPEVEDPSY